MKRLSSLIVCALLAACSGKKEGPGAAVSTLDGFCTEWAKRACGDAVVSACVSDAGGCQAAQHDFCTSLVPDGKYSYASSEECLDAVQRAYEDASLTADERDTVLQLGNECSKIASGSVGVDGDCDKDSDCNRESDLSCIVKASGKGTCQKAVEVGGGLDCSTPETQCAAGFYCDEGAHCVQSAKIGQSCSATKPCGPDSRCVANTTPTGDGGASTSDGTCEARGDTGTDCDVDDECVSRICLPKAGSASGVCSPKIPLSPAYPICGDLG